MILQMWQKNFPNVIFPDIWPKKFPKKKDLKNLFEYLFIFIFHILLKFRTQKNTIQSSMDDGHFSYKQKKS
jgi:hypothetical protein